jgi:tRNA pseudouridine13 synthase
MRAEAIFKRLQADGVPNRFGEQRYGILNNSHHLGRLILQKDYDRFCMELIGDPQQITDPQWRQAAQAFRAGDLDLTLEHLPKRMRDELRLLQTLKYNGPAEHAVLNLPRPLLRLFLSAYQSHLFDQLLEQRLPFLDRLEPGDLAVKHANGACFQVINVEEEQMRADCFEISPSAPLFGHKVLLAKERPGDRERQLLAQEGLMLKDWKIGEGLTMPGERRPLRILLGNAQVIRTTDGLQLDFSLPKGSYATSVLHELMKSKVCI